MPITHAPTIFDGDRILCGTNTWCYYVDVFPINNVTSEKLWIYSEISGEINNHEIYITSIDNNCINPTIDVIFEEIDFSSPTTEYFDVFDENNSLLIRCTADQDYKCLVWDSCFDNLYLPISQINSNDTYKLRIEGSSALNTLCTSYRGVSYHSYSLNIELTITCGAG